MEKNRVNKEILEKKVIIATQIRPPDRRRPHRFVSECVD